MKEDFSPKFGPGRHRLSITEVRGHLAPDGASERRLTMYLAFYALYKRLLQLDVLCEIWLDGSYVTVKTEPSDIDLSIMLHEDTYVGLSEPAKELLDDISYSNEPYLKYLDAFVCIYGTKGSDSYELDDPLDWAHLWGKEHSGRYLKGFVIVEVKP